MVAKKIYTVDDDFNCENAMVIKNGKIVELGESSFLIKKYPEAQIVKDFEGDYIYPGFIEPHLHVVGTGAMFATLIPVSFTDWTIGGRTYEAVDFHAGMKARV